jgi:hypothetical protein
MKPLARALTLSALATSGLAAQQTPDWAANKAEAIRHLQDLILKFLYHAVLNVAAAPPGRS